MMLRVNSCVCLVRIWKIVINTVQSCKKYLKVNDNNTYFKTYNKLSHSVK